MLFVIGDLLLRLCSLHDVTLCFVPGYEIKHVLGLQRGKSDPLDTCRIREYGDVFMTVYIPVSIIVRKCRNFRSCIVRFPCGIA